MFRKLFFLLSCIIILNVYSASLNLSFHAGTLLKIERITDSVRLVNKTAAIKGGLLLAGQNNSALAEDLEALEGQVFIVLTVSLAGGRSISPFDYTLQVDAVDYPCLAMAQSNSSIFDFRFIECEGPNEIQLLFACPDSAYNAVLKSAYSQLPVPVISSLVLQKKENVIVENLEKTEEVEEIAEATDKDDEKAEDEAEED